MHKPAQMQKKFFQKECYKKYQTHRHLYRECIIQQLLYCTLLLRHGNSRNIYQEKHFHRQLAPQIRYLSFALFLIRYRKKIAIIHWHLALLFIYNYALLYNYGINFFVLFQHLSISYFFFLKDQILPQDDGQLESCASDEDFHLISFHLQHDMLHEKTIIIRLLLYNVFFLTQQTLLVYRLTMRAMIMTAFYNKMSENLTAGLSLHRKALEKNDSQKDLYTAFFDCYSIDTLPCNFLRVVCMVHLHKT